MNDLPKFKEFTCIGDTVQWDRDGFTFIAKVLEDPTATPNDYECYSASDIASWFGDDWQYVGLIVGVWFNGIELDKCATSIWSIECNFPNDKEQSGLNNCLADLADEALALGIALADKLTQAWMKRTLDGLDCSEKGQMKKAKAIATCLQANAV